MMAARNVLALAGLLSVATASCGAPSPQQPRRHLAEKQIEAVVLAIEDEIYDYDLQTEFADLSADPRQGRVRVYIDPVLDPDAGGTLIYKLLPYGEVIRDFQIVESGLVLLVRNPFLGFHPTSSSMLSLYLDDDTVIEHKQKWLKREFTVVFEPSRERVKQAMERQKKRYGFSHLESERQPAGKTPKPRQRERQK